MKTKSPKKCPYCGSHYLSPEYRGSDKLYILCTVCNARGPEGKTINEAVEKWNKG